MCCADQRSHRFAAGLDTSPTSAVESCCSVRIRRESIERMSGRNATWNAPLSTENSRCVDRCVMLPVGFPSHETLLPGAAGLREPALKDCFLHRPRGFRLQETIRALQVLGDGHSDVLLTAVPADLESHALAGALRLNRALEYGGGCGSAVDAQDAVARLKSALGGGGIGCGVRNGQTEDQPTASLAAATNDRQFRGRNLGGSGVQTDVTAFRRLGR